MIVIVFLLGFTFVSCGTTNQSNDKLIFAQVVMRHGDRNVRFAYETDPYKDKSNWPEGLGQLTNQGQQRSFELGKFLRRRYKNLLGDGAYSPDKVFVMSSAIDRTMNTASLVLAALFPPKNNQLWNRDLLWIPIPIHTVPKSLDFLIVAEMACARYVKALEEYENSPEVRAVTDQYQHLYQYLEEHAGQPIRTLQHIKDLHGILDVEHKLNKTLPEWAQKIEAPGGDLQFLGEYWLKFNSGTTELNKLKGGFLLKDILDRFTNKTQSTLSPDYSLWIYSGHDVTIAALLSSLGLFDPPHIPPYSSSVLFELYETMNKDYYVKVFYRNSATEEPAPLNIPNCGTKCPLHKFYSLYNDILPYDFETECH